MRARCHRSLPRALFIGALLLVLAPLALAAGGRIPIYEVPITIDAPGSYYLTRDITHSGGGISIVVASDDVSIDFAGHTLTKENAGNYTVSLDGDYTNFEIRNGTIVGGNIGIRIDNDSGDDLSVLIENMTVREALNEGIYIQGHSLIGSSHVHVRNNIVHDVGNDGISLRFIWGGRVENNVIQGAGDGSGDHGIYFHSCRGVTISRNTISHSGADGIRVWYSWYIAIDWNHMTYNDGWGLDIFDGDQIVFSNNRAYGNGSGGFDIPGAEGHVNAGGNYPPP